MKQERNINITDVDQMAQLRDKQAQRLNKDSLDGWNSAEPLDLINRGLLIVSAIAATASIWQLSQWNGVVMVLLTAVNGTTIALIRYYHGKKAIGSIVGFFQLALVGLLIGLNLPMAWADLTALVHRAIGGLF